MIKKKNSKTWHCIPIINTTVPIIVKQSIYNKCSLLGETNSGVENKRLMEELCTFSLILL